jgi:hypothetical protein
MAATRGTLRSRVARLRGLLERVNKNPDGLRVALRLKQEIAQAVDEVPEEEERVIVIMGRMKDGAVKENQVVAVCASKSIADQRMDGFIAQGIEGMYQIAIEVLED